MKFDNGFVGDIIKDDLLRGRRERENYAKVDHHQHYHYH